jgi:hypothetical protein
MLFTVRNNRPCSSRRAHLSLDNGFDIKAISDAIIDRIDNNEMRIRFNEVRLTNEVVG